MTYCQALQEVIFKEIKQQGGRIPFSRYMDLALYAPSLGYYRSGLQKFGKEGDYITAPHVSPLFSGCLARQCQQVLSFFKGEGNILEIGAGDGQMAADILCYLEKVDSLPQQYLILELSSELKIRQQEKIKTICPHLLPRLIWVKTLPTLKFRGVILANEVLDAMPVNRFQIKENQIYETYVAVQNKEFVYENILTENKALLTLFKEHVWPHFYTSEVNSYVRPWIASLSDILNAGVILLIDYGFPAKEYYHADRREGTLMCHYQHHAHSDPFLHLGLQDITAHVDFSAVAKAGGAENLEILGYARQASFLMSCGLNELVEQNTPKTDKEIIRRSQAITTLISPAEMGELFKVIAFGRNIEEPLIGFDTDDRQFEL